MSSKHNVSVEECAQDKCKSYDGKQLLRRLPYTVQLAYLYCRMACCLLHEGWSVGTSAIRRSLPKK